MKSLFLIVAIVCSITVQCVVQFDQDKALYLAKYEKYRKMKSTGRTLTLGGSVLMIAGIATIANSTYTTTYNSYGNPQTTSSGNPGAGLAAYLIGAAGLGAGIPLWIVGGVSKGKYERKLQGEGVT